MLHLPEDGGADSTASSPGIRLSVVTINGSTGSANSKKKKNDYMHINPETHKKLCKVTVLNLEIYDT